MESSVPTTAGATDAAPPASLDSLVGPRRAAILLRLDAFARAGHLSAALTMRPGGTTYHLRCLEAAGRVTRTRRGCHVIVERTARGTALVALYAQSSRTYGRL